MATTYSTSLKLTLLGTGDGTGTWGNTTNTNLGTLLEQAITGVQSIVMSDADYTLTSYNGLSDESRNAVLVCTSSTSLTATRSVIAPLVNKTYIIYNNTTGGRAITIIGASGSGVTINNGSTVLVYCNGTNFYSAVSGSGSNAARGAVYENTQSITANYIMSTGYNGESVGPITISSGVTVTIPSGSRWVVL
jgi:hypothetical protein